MVELVIVMILVGILSAVGFPKMMAAINLRDDAWHDELQSALRFAQKGAVARRRLTCVSVAATSVTITTASANPSAICDLAVTGPNGSSTFATADNSGANTTVATLYFQPDGRVTSGAAGATTTSPTISMSGSNSIVVYGDTGYVQ